MRRWHSPRERTIMLRRWRLEIAVHERRDGGMGFLRKRKPYDCGRPRCGLCHGDKFHAPKARARRLREAVEFELRAS